MLFPSFNEAAFISNIALLLVLFYLRFAVKELSKERARADEGWQHAENEHQRAVLLECKCNKLIGEKAQGTAMLGAANKLNGDLINEIDRLRARLKKAHR